MMQILVTTAAHGTEDITDRVSAWSYDTRVGIGFATARVSIASPRRDLWHLLHAGGNDTIEFRYAGVLVWRGFCAGAILRGAQLELSAEGRGMRLNDTEVWRVFADSGYGAWDVGATPDGFRADNNNRVYVEADGTFADGAEGRMVYPDAKTEVGAGIGIVRVEAHALVTVVSGTWVVELRDAAGAVLWSTTTDVDVDEDVAVSVAESSGLVWALRKDGAGTGQATARLTQVVVRTVYPCTSSAVISALLSDAGIETTHIADSGLVVDRAIWQGEGRGTAIREMAELGDGQTSWVFTVYEEARLEAWPESAMWLVQAGEADVEVGYRRDAVVNAVRARLPDGYMTEWMVDVASSERWGRRERTLEIGQTSRAEAARLAAIYLADHAWPMAGVRIDAGAVIRAVDGSPWPVWRLRAGQVVMLRDVFPYRDVAIRVGETQATPSGVQIVPVGADDRLEVYLAAQARRVQRVARLD